VSAAQFRLQLAAVLWRFLGIEGHEHCVAAAVGVGSFLVVTTVPSGSRERDADHPLRDIVGRIVEPTSERYERLLERSSKVVADHAYDEEKFSVRRPLDGEPVLLIDDTWTTGANSQSAAAALRAAGADDIGIVCIGRHVHENFQDNSERLQALPRPICLGNLLASRIASPAWTILPRRAALAG
jgi:predicted phosphoribosyltransferase